MDKRRRPNNPAQAAPQNIQHLPSYPLPVIANPTVTTAASTTPTPYTYSFSSSSSSTTASSTASSSSSERRRGGGHSRSAERPRGRGAWGPSRVDLSVSDSDGDDSDDHDLNLDTDMQSLFAIFPDAQPSFLRRTLQGMPAEPNRVMLVSNLLLERGSYPRERFPSPPPRPIAAIPEDSPRVNGRNSGRSQREVIMADLTVVCSAFPDVEPDYVYNMLEGLMDQSTDARRNLVSQNLLSRPYPKVSKAVIPKDSEEVRKKRAIDEAMIFNKHTFQQQKVEYYDTTRTIAADSPYGLHALAKLQNTFPRTPVTFIRRTLEEFAYHYLPSLRKLEKIHAPEVKKLPYRAIKAPRPECPMPAEPNIAFLKELTFALNEPNMDREAAEKALKREADLEIARKEGTLVECGCCFEEENLVSETEACDAGHAFCVDCVRRAAEDVIGKGRLEFKCLSSAQNCQASFSSRVMERVLLPAVYKGYLVRQQQDELKRSGIDDLAMCPFCDFAVIMPNKQDRVLKCLNEDCLRESCRLCREPSHIPLRCEEVEKNDEKSLRLHMESKMTAALLRTCVKCNRQFFKTEGCNHMTCTCGAEMCYVCGETLKKGKWSQHFASNEHPERCPMYFKDTVVADAKLVQQAGLKALEDYKKEHPEAQNIELKYDPRGAATAPKKKPPKKRSRV